MILPALRLACSNRSYNLCSLLSLYLLKCIDYMSQRPLKRKLGSKNLRDCQLLSGGRIKRRAVLSLLIPTSQSPRQREPIAIRVPIGNPRAISKQLMTKLVIQPDDISDNIADVPSFASCEPPNSLRSIDKTIETVRFCDDGDSSNNSDSDDVALSTESL